MDTIGKFQVIEKIGEGGFGVIHLGFDPHIKRRVAIKSCTSEDRDVRNRFFQEARIAGNLHHRNVVTVYDFGLEGEVPYLVQEYLSGEDLDRKIKRRDPMPFADRLRFLVQIARGLEYAHAQGVIHRDIKPANVRILEDGTAKIMDFGIAKLANQETGLTQTGMTLGTASYLAPEQIRGEAVDPRTDIFSFGALAYELLSYQRPFDAQHISTVLYQILNEAPPPLIERAPDCPPELVALVNRCLEKRLEGRYPSCTELLEELARIRRQGSAVVGSDSEPLGAGLATGRTHTRGDATRFDAVQVGEAAPAAPGDSPHWADYELASTVDSVRTPRSISTAETLRHRSLPWGRWAAAAGVMLLATFTGWYLLRGPAESAPATLAAERSLEAAGDPHQELLQQAPPETEPLMAALPPPQPGEEVERVEGHEPADGRADADAEPGEEWADEPPAVDEPPPPPPPTVLVIARAWSPRATVQVAGAQHRLDGERRLELPPGRHTLRFAVAEDGYRDFESLTVDLQEGKERRVSVPLQRPGQLQIQPRIGTPPGEVFLGGELLGTVPPIVERRLRPGRYTLLAQRAGEAGEELQVEVEIASGQRTVATFDLTGGRWTVPPARPLD